MKTILLSTTLILTYNFCAFSQAKENSGYRYLNYFDLAASGSGNKFAIALSWSHLHSLGKNQKFHVGYGLRYTSFVAANKYYTTAPAKFTSTVQNLGTLFSKTIDDNIDTITTPTTSTNSINIMISLHYSFTSKVEVGFNIDAVGFSFGPQKQFDIISSSYDTNQSPVQSGSPTRLNLLLTSDNDIGSLNSEFYARYWITERIGFRAGYTFLFSEYQTDRTLSFNNDQIRNDRYRYKASMALLAISYKPFN